MPFFAIKQLTDANVSANNYSRLTPHASRLTPHANTQTHKHTNNGLARLNTTSGVFHSPVVWL
jgi:hypothetical protein